MKVSLHLPHELGFNELEAWRNIQSTSDGFANPFLSPEFASAVSKRVPSARVAVIEEGSKPVGFFAFQLGRFGVGQPIGAGICDLQAVVHEVGFELDLHDLMRRCRLNVWEFDHLIAAQQPSGPGFRRTTTSPIIDISKGYDHYLADGAERTKRFFKTLLYKQRKMSREVEGVEYQYDSQDPAHLQQLIGWKSEQYKRTGYSDRFAQSWIRETIEELYATNSPTCSGAVATLSAEGKLISAEFSLRSSSVLCTWFPAQGKEHTKYSPGLLRILETAKAAADNGIDHIDLGKGEEEYKQQIKTGDLTICEGSAEIPSAIAFARRAQHAPKRYALDFVLSRPRLRLAARHTLRRIGEFRSR